MVCVLTNQSSVRYELWQKQNSYHPIRDKLNTLVWDGEERLQHVLTKYLGAPASPLPTESLKVFMLGAIERVFHPGCKFEYMLCLVGGQGAGKSTFLRFLAMEDAWFTDDIRKLNDIYMDRGIYFRLYECEYENVAMSIEKRKQEEYNKKIASFEINTDYRSLEDCNLVIETVIENNSKVALLGDAPGGHALQAVLQGQFIGYVQYFLTINFFSSCHPTAPSIPKISFLPLSYKTQAPTGKLE